jgi:type IV secretion system protein VirB10
MSAGDHPDAARPEAAETLELRARPAPVTRINRKVLIGAAAVLLLVISLIVLAALSPPHLRESTLQELITVDRKPITDRLAMLPASYDALAPEQPNTAQRVPALAPAAAPAQASAPELAERERRTRLSGQAAQSALFFSLQPKQPSTEARPDAVGRPATEGGDVQRLPEHKRAEPGGEQEAPADAAEGARKLAFLRRGPEVEIYNAHALQRPLSPYQLMAGTVIAASLITGLNSDLPGFVIAAVTENVYDTASGRYLLIPQGARLIGKYDNVVAFGQERALLVWQRIIFPDGSSVTIDNLPATDASGYAGLADAVDAHTWTLLKGVALATLLGVGSQLGVGTGSGSDSDLVKALQQSVAVTTNRAGQRLVERNLNVQPTITVRPGWPLRVIVHKDLLLQPYHGSTSP